MFGFEDEAARVVEVDELGGRGAFWIDEGDASFEYVRVFGVVGNGWIWTWDAEKFAEFGQEELIIGSLGTAGGRPTFDEGLDWIGLHAVVGFEVSSLENSLADLYGPRGIAWVGSLDGGDKAGNSEKPCEQGSGRQISTLPTRRQRRAYRANGRERPSISEIKWLRAREMPRRERGIYLRLPSAGDQ